MVRRSRQRSNYFQWIYLRSFKELKVETLRMILGHSNILTIQIYVTLACEEVKAAMNGFKQFVR
jgi:hypothetical protein